MELIYTALLLYKAKKEINESNVKHVLDAAGIKKTDAEVKALVAALHGVDIEKAIKEAAMPVAVAPAAGHVEAKKEEKKPEDDKKSEEQAAAGLSSLFS